MEVHSNMLFHVLCVVIFFFYIKANFFKEFKNVLQPLQVFLVDKSFNSTTQNILNSMPRRIVDCNWFPCVEFQKHDTYIYLFFPLLFNKPCSVLLNSLGNGKELCWNEKPSSATTL